MNIVVKVGMTLLFCVPMLASASEGDTIPVNEIMALVQKEQLSPLVEYCKESNPKLRKKISKAYKKASKTIDDASEFIVEFAKNSGEESVPKKDVEEMLSGIREFGNSMLMIIKEKNQPEAFCNKFYSRLQNTSKKELEASMKKSFEEYQARVKSTKEN